MFILHDLDKKHTLESKGRIWSHFVANWRLNQGFDPTMGVTTAMLIGLVIVLFTILFMDIVQNAKHYSCHD